MEQVVQRRATGEAKRESVREGGPGNGPSAAFGTEGKMRWPRRPVGKRPQALQDVLEICSLACELL